MGKLYITVGSAALALLSACSTPDGDRAAMGAVFGGLGAALLDGNVLLGAAGGAAAGALCDDAGVCN